MFNRYQLNVRPYMAPEGILSVKTNTDLVFVFDNLLPDALLNELQQYDYGSLDWVKRPNSYAGGGTSRCTFNVTKPPYPSFLITTKRHIIRGLKQAFNEDLDIDGICMEFLLHSVRDNEAVGQQLHKDCQELGAIWTILIHIAGKDGNTQFTADVDSTDIIHSVEFKPGRVVLFPSIYSHNGQLPSEGDRYVLTSIVKLKNFSYSRKILECSPDLHSMYADKML